MNRKPFHQSCAIALIGLMGATGIRAAEQSVLASGLNTPVKIDRLANGKLLVAEAGTPQPNTGRLTLVTPRGNTSSLVSGLPSGVLLTTGPLGPAGFEVSQNQKVLTVVIGAGDATVLSDEGIEICNPIGPSTPLLSSVLRIVFSEPIGRIQSPFDLMIEDHYEIANGRLIELTNDQGVTATFSTLTDFRDVIRSLETGTVARSNPFDLSSSGGRFFVTDSSRNSLEVVNSRTGQSFRTLDFEPFPVPGGGLSEAVPTGITRFGSRFLIAMEAGDAVGPGISRILEYDPRTNRVSEFITGLTQALDILPKGNRRSSGFYVVELTTDITVFAPGRLLFYRNPKANPVVLSDSLIFPSSVTRNPRAGILYVTEAATGNIIAIRE